MCATWLASRVSSPSMFAAEEDRIKGRSVGRLRRCVSESLELLKPGGDKRGLRLLLGLSGGADSVALLIALVEAKVDVRAVHCNFSLRGEESNRDQRFVETLCERLSVPLTVKRFDTHSYCAQRRLSLEDGCRRLRYNFFSEEMRRQDCLRVAVAHHADDNAETLMLGLMRGAGLRGLKGMLADTGEVIRPLLRCRRADIISYLEEKGEGFVTDSTNLNSDFNRNFIRNDVIPMLASRWPSALASIARSAECLCEDFKLLLPMIESLGEKQSLNYSMLASSASPRSLIYYFICGKGGKGGSRVIAEEMLAVWLKRRVGAVWHLDGIDVVAGRTAFEKVDSNQSDIPQLEVEAIRVDDEVMRLIHRPDGNHTLWLAENPVAYRLRLRRSGDRICPLGMNGSSLVSDIVKDAHLDAVESRNVFVLEHAADGEIIWIPGLKRSRHRLIDLSSPPPLVYRLRIKQ